MQPEIDIRKMAKELIRQAVLEYASDIHILPDLEAYDIYLRHAGGLHIWKTISLELGERLIAYYKYLADMDVGEHRRPQSGSARMELDENERHLRFSTMTNLHARESLVIRLLNSMQNFDLRQHTFFPQTIDHLESLVNRQSGLILFSGPVGSGKTTTMYQLLRTIIQEEQKNIICIEDPVEIEESAFLQLNVNEQAGISYEKLLRQSLRHHPDIIIIGEIRDEETAQAVIRAALTGHLILATVHAKNAEGVVSRLLDLGVSEFLLKQVIHGVVFQKMLPRYCAQCGTHAQIACSHYHKMDKQAVLFDVRDSYDSLMNHNEGLNFNAWLERALKNDAISEKTYLQHYIS